jgi:ubiquinone/menaquinone biosynthesis C-methylase UbiE
MGGGKGPHRNARRYGAAKGPRAKEWREADAERTRFVERLASLRILDPACGSGNFLYMALQRVKDLEFRVDSCGMLEVERGRARWVRQS